MDHMERRQKYFAIADEIVGKDFGDKMERIVKENNLSEDEIDLLCCELYSYVGAARAMIQMRKRVTDWKARKEKKIEGENNG